MEIEIGSETEWLLHVLSLKPVYSVALPELEFYIPDTLFYKTSEIPHRWYFSSKSGAVCHKLRHNTQLDNIKETFMHRCVENDICAVSYAIFSMGTVVNIETEYITRNDFEKFLLCSDKKYRIVQSFVLPFGTKNNSIIEVNLDCEDSRWKLERVSNINQFNMQRLSASERAATVEAPEYLVNRTDSISSRISEKIKASCQSIAEYINLVSFKQYSLKRLHVWFKVDQKERIVLLFCCQLKITVNFGKLPKGFQRHVDSTIYTFLSRCNADLRLQKRGRTPLEPLLIEDEREQCAFCLRKMSQPKNYLNNAKIMEMYKTYMDSYSADSSRGSPRSPRSSRRSQIPSVISHLYPTMTQVEFIAHQNDPGWLSRKVPTCPTCFKILSTFTLERYFKKKQYWNSVLIYALRLHDHSAKKSFIISKVRNASYQYSALLTRHQRPSLLSTQRGLSKNQTQLYTSEFYPTPEPYRTNNPINSLSQKKVALKRFIRLSSPFKSPNPALRTFRHRKLHLTSIH